MGGIIVAPTSKTVRDVALSRWEQTDWHAAANAALASQLAALGLDFNDIATDLDTVATDLGIETFTEYLTSYDPSAPLALVVAILSAIGDISARYADLDLTPAVRTSSAGTLLSTDVLDLDLTPTASTDRRTLFGDLDTPDPTHPKVLRAGCWLTEGIIELTDPAGTSGDLGSIVLRPTRDADHDDGTAGETQRPAVLTLPAGPWPTGTGLSDHTVSLPVSVWWDTNGTAGIGMQLLSLSTVDLDVGAVLTHRYLGPKAS